MNDKTEYTADGSIAVIALQNPPVNALGSALRTAIFQGLKKAILYMGKRVTMGVTK